MAQVTRERLLDAIIQGIKKAQQDYDKMSDTWVWQGSEYWITTYVARALWKVSGDGTVVVEGRSGAVHEEAGKRKKGRPLLLAQNKRYDIVIYYKNESPRAVIEIKNQQGNARVIDDVKRVIAALKTAQLNFGAVGYYIAKGDDEKQSALKKVREFAKNIEDKATELAGAYQFSAYSKEYSSVEDDSAWLAGCIVIERKPGNLMRPKK